MNVEDVEGFYVFGILEKVVKIRSFCSPSLKIETFFTSPDLCLIGGTPITTG